jgi:sec-independent protein translocase protein TatC
MEEPILVYLKVSFYAGLVIAAPFILIEICRFISPGLTDKERKIVLPVIIASPVLFACGAAFAYFCVLPSMLHFFTSFGEGFIQVNQRLDFYISLVSSFLLYMGLCFQLPLVICALSFTGLVTSKHLLKFWRYAIFGAGVVAAVVTPDPTAFSMLVTMAALVALYGLSILLVKFFGK